MGTSNGKYVVVVQCSDGNALAQKIPMRVFVLPTPTLSKRDQEDIAEAGEKGGVEVFMFAALDWGVENVKWELMNANLKRRDAL